MRAVIVSSGEGTRLRPITCSIPVSMMQIMGRPLIEHTVRLLHLHKVYDVTICADYLADKILEHFSTVKISDMHLSFESTKNLGDFFDDDVNTHLSTPFWGRPMRYFFRLTGQKLHTTTILPPFLSHLIKLMTD